MTSHMDFETAGFVIRLVAAWVGAGEVTRFPEVSAIVGEQGTEGDEGFLAACTGQKRTRKKEGLTEKCILYQEYIST